jgi:hypothetical protein
VVESLDEILILFSFLIMLINFNLFILSVTHSLKL